MSRRAPLETVRPLLGAADVVDGLGMLPLHHAVAAGASAEVVGALLASHPNAAARADRDGRLALHFAAARRAPLEVIEQLLAAYPEAAAMPDGATGRQPAALASEHKAAKEVVEALVRAAGSGAAASGGVEGRRTAAALGRRKTINLHIHKRVDPIAKTAITRRCAVQGWSQVFKPGWTPKKIKKSRLCACAGSLKHKGHWSPENQDCGKKNQEIGKIPSSSFNVKMICYIGER